MNQGIAVVLGALIALTGSSFIPWIRESLSARREESQRRKQRTHDAVIDLLAANAALGAALTIDDNAAFQRAYEARGRAAGALLIELPPEDREGLSAAMAKGAPARSDTAFRVRAFQNVLIGWAAGDIAAPDTEERYQRELDRLRAS